MPLYLTESKFSQDSLKALADRPSDRQKMVSKVIRAYGGKLKNFYWVFGEVDVIFIYGAPDHEAAMSILMTLSASGGIETHKTTALLTNSEAMNAMSSAGTKKTGYRSPREVWEGWRDEGGEG